MADTASKEEVLLYLVTLQATTIRGLLADIARYKMQVDRRDAEYAELVRQLEELADYIVGGQVKNV